MKLPLVLFLSFFVLFGCTRSDNLRVRALAPIQEESGNDDLVSTEQSNGSVSSIGFRTVGRGYSFVYKGLSIGMTELNTDRSTRSKSGSDVLLDEYFSTQATYNELGLMLGDDFTFTFGVGGLVSGSGELKLDYGTSLGGTSETLMTTKPSGNSAFFTFGYDFQPIEILLGWRWNNFKASYNSQGSTLELLQNSESLNYPTKSFSRQTSHITAGLGTSF
jgi:hypothetical protein